MKRLLAVFVVLVFAVPAFAVSGYKDFKFGMSKSQVKKLTSDCTNAEQFTGGMEALACSLNVGGQKRIAFFYFPGGKLMRIGISYEAVEAKGLASALVDKYGPPSTPPNIEQLGLVDTMPNMSSDIAFDDDTVILRFTSDENMKQSILMIYTSPLYDSAVTNETSNKLKDDL
jgi:hypothetical protein